MEVEHRSNYLDLNISLSSEFSSFRDGRANFLLSPSRSFFRSRIPQQSHQGLFKKIVAESRPQRSFREPADQSALKLLHSSVKLVLFLELKSAPGAPG